MATADSKVQDFLGGIVWDEQVALDGVLYNHHVRIE